MPLLSDGLPHRGGFERDLRGVREQLHEETVNDTWAEGRAMKLEEALTEALAE
jgi:hypothetical protein